jgi:hypothetical protein
MFPPTQAQAAHQSVTQAQQWQMRFGCIAARIGADLPHKLNFPLPVALPQGSTATDVKSAQGVAAKRHPYEVHHDERQKPDAGSKNPITSSSLMMASPPVPRAAKAGSTVYLTVQDVTRFPEEAEHAHWVCKHPDCRGNKWESKKQMLADHPANKELAAQQQTHVYYAVFEDAGTPARAEKRNGDKLVEPAREATGARVMLLSDEE